MKLRPLSPFALALGAALLALSPTAADAQASDTVPPADGRRWSLWVSEGVGGSPLGEIAERWEALAVPGQSLDFRATCRTRPTREWYAGITVDQFRLGDQLDRWEGRRIEYTSGGVLIGFLATDSAPALPLFYGADLGVSRFHVEGAAFNKYSGQREASETEGTVLVAGLTSGIEVPVRDRLALVPHVRATVNFPDFGGGDGYSGLHRETDVGFKLFFNLALRFYL